jgi:hypothetical protein
MLATFCGVGIVPASAQAQDCSDKTEFLSDEWILSKMDCGADKLIDKGTSALTDIGVDVLKAAANYYVPGITSLIWNEEDPFAAHFSELKDHMTMEADRIIDEMQRLHRRQQTLDIIGAISSIDDFKDDPLYIRSENLATIQGVDDVLERFAMDLMWPKEATFSENAYFDFDFSEMTPPDVDRLHHLMLTNALRVEFFPLMATAEAYKGIVNDGDHPTTEELALVTQVAAREADSDLNLMLEDLALYFDALSDQDMFRGRSNQRIAWEELSIRDERVCGQVSLLFHKAAVGEDPLATNDRLSWEFEFADYGRQGTPPGCWGNWSMFGLTLWKDPSGTVHPGTEMQWDDFQVFQNYAYASTQGTGYREFILASYGSARPVIARWYRKIGKNAPRRQIDDDLRLALRGIQPVATMLDAANNLVGGQLSEVDKRAAEDVVLESGFGKLYTFALVVSGSDYLNDGRPLQVRDMRRFLYGQAGQELVPELAAAKFNAITQL